MYNSHLINCNSHSTASRVARLYVCCGGGGGGGGDCGDADDGDGSGDKGSLTVVPTLPSNAWYIHSSFGPSLSHLQSE